MAYVYGARVDRAGEIRHGKTSQIHHNGAGVLTGLPNPFEAIRYHSLVVYPETVPDSWEVTARSENGLIMGIRHKEHPVEGIQFHPESIMTPTARPCCRTTWTRCHARQGAGEMTAKDEILELMKRIPDNLTVDEALEQLQLLYDVHKGLEEAERGETVPQ